MINSNKTIKELHISKRILPHWENPGSVYFITIRTYKKLILDSRAKQIIYDNLMFYHEKLYQLYSFVVMPDHLHIILQPLETKANEYVGLSVIIHSIKSYASNQIGKHLKAKKIEYKHIFQSERFDRIIRNDKELYQKLNYIYNNPYKKGLTDDPINYKWFYINEKIYSLII